MTQENFIFYNWPIISFYMTTWHPVKELYIFRNLVIIIIIITLFQEVYIFGMYASLTYGLVFSWGGLFGGCVPFPFGVLDRMLASIVSAPHPCLFILFSYFVFIPHGVIFMVWTMTVFILYIFFSILFSSFKIQVYWDLEGNRAAHRNGVTESKACWSASYVLLQQK